MSVASAYPLTWPEMFPRSKSRERGQFRTTLNGALANVEKSLAGFSRDSKRRLDNLVISSNVTLGARKPDDPGVAVWFGWDGLSVCIAVDRYTSVEANLQAIHHIIEARRVELRHGTLALVRATFQGFAALPPPPGSRPARHWRDVLDVPLWSAPDTDAINRAYRAKATEAHPDTGGSDEAMAELNRARDEALKEIHDGGKHQ